MDLVERRAGLAEEVERHPWEMARLEVLVRLLGEHIRLRPDAVVVDIGCGDGFVAGALADRFPGITVLGVDPGLTDAMIGAFEQRRPDRGVRLFSTLDSLAGAMSAPAAVVLLMDVIEHIEHDDAFLQDLRVRQLVGHETRVVLTVPAFQALFSAHDVFLRHYRRYTYPSLRSVLERTGWRVVDGGYFFTSLLAIRALEAFRERLTGRGSGGGLGASSRSSPFSFRRRLLTIDAAIGLSLRRVGIRLPGLSAFAICRTSA